jgi:hypothetical protein
MKDMKQQQHRQRNKKKLHEENAEKAAEFRFSDFQMLGRQAWRFSCVNGDRNGLLEGEERGKKNIQIGHKLRVEEGYLHNSFFSAIFEASRGREAKKCLIIKSA